MRLLPTTNQQDEMNAAFDDSDDEEHLHDDPPDQDRAPLLLPSQPTAQSSPCHPFAGDEDSSTSPLNMRPSLTMSAPSLPIPGTYDFEYDYPPPLGSPPPAIAYSNDPNHTIEGPWILSRNLRIILRYKIFGRFWYNASRDVASDQAVSSDDKDRERLRAMDARAKQYSNRTEHCFSFVQVLTACTASFAHGSNDLANAAGPLSTIYLIWDSGNFSGSRSPTPIWALVFCAAALVIRLATYGYTVMSVLGNRITLHSPSRGYTMELGAATTVVSSQLGLPVSTAQSIFGTTVAVGSAAETSARLTGRCAFGSSLDRSSQYLALQ